jgi:hypothetical protein
MFASHAVVPLESFRYHTEPDANASQGGMNLNSLKLHVFERDHNRAHRSHSQWITAPFSERLEAFRRNRDEGRHALTHQINGVPNTIPEDDEEYKCTESTADEDRAARYVDFYSEKNAHQETLCHYKLLLSARVSVQENALFNYLNSVTEHLFASSVICICVARCIEFCMDVGFDYQRPLDSFGSHQEQWIQGWQLRTTTSFWRVLAYILMCFVLLESPLHGGRYFQFTPISITKRFVVEAGRLAIRLVVTGGLGVSLAVAVASSSDSRTTGSFGALAVAVHLAWLFPLATVLRTVGLHMLSLWAGMYGRERSHAVLSYTALTTQTAILAGSLVCNAFVLYKCMPVIDSRGWTRLLWTGFVHPCARLISHWLTNNVCSFYQAAVHESSGNFFRDVLPNNARSVYLIYSIPASVLVHSADSISSMAVYIAGSIPLEMTFVTIGIVWNKYTRQSHAGLWRTYLVLLSNYVFVTIQSVFIGWFLCTRSNYVKWSDQPDQGMTAAFPEDHMFRLFVGLVGVLLVVTFQFGMAKALDVQIDYAHLSISPMQLLRFSKECVGIMSMVFAVRELLLSERTQLNVRVH